MPGSERHYSQFTGDGLMALYGLDAKGPYPRVGIYVPKKMQSNSESRARFRFNPVETRSLSGKYPPAEPEAL